MHILTTDHTYGAAGSVAERLAKRWNGEVVSVRSPITSCASEVVEMLSEQNTDRTSLIIGDQVTSFAGGEFLAAEIAAMGRSAGIRVLIDAAPEPGLHDTPLSAIDKDYWVGNLHKFDTARRGCAEVATRAEVSPPIGSWGAPHAFPHIFDYQGTFDQSSHLATPTSFETVEEQFGWDVAREHSRSPGDYAESIAINALNELTDTDAHVDAGIPVDGMRITRFSGPLETNTEESAALRTHLSTKHRLESQIASRNGLGFLALSIHVYNTPDDVEQFVERVVPAIAELDVGASSVHKGF